MLPKKRINSARRIALGFAALIFAGALALMLPISSKSGDVTPFLTALFTATSATCVTGLTLVNVGEYFSLFGQLVLLVLIQLGGLGFMTVLCIAFFVSKRQIGLRDRMLIAQSMGTESLEGVVKLVKHVLYITFSAELAGAVILAVRFIPRFGWAKGIWFGIFHSVSAFCNAGFDLLGDSFMSCGGDAVVLLTAAALIIIGGLGFIVWEDILKRKRLSMYSKTVLISTVILITAGTAVYFLLERGNSATIGDFGTGKKLLASFFQSVTTRTAGFDAVGQSALTEQSKLWGTVLMMIGGASGSTAGGIKIGTAALIVMSLGAVLRSRPDIVIFGRRVGHSVIIHAMALFVIWLVLIAAGGIAVSLWEGCTLTDAVYETASAYSTVGLSVGITESASLFTKLLLMVYMFFGRVGIMTVSVSFMVRSAKSQDIRYPDGDFIIG